MLKTRLTELFDIRYPIMSAPMSLHSGGELAAAVSQAGGLGMFGGTNPAGPEWVEKQIHTIRSQTDKPFGVGFITHLIPTFPQLFEVVLEAHVPVIGFSFADPQPWLGRAKARGAMTLCQVQTLQGAREAIAAGADILVAQGHEAGGHTGKMPLFPLLTRLLDMYPDIPVLAAGGIANGSTLAAALASGAAGAWVGTAFLATPECVEVPDAYKERLVASRGEDTIFTEVFDILDPAIFKIPAWPEGIAARVCNNRFVQAWHGREEELRRNLDQVVPAYREALERRDPDVCAVYMGQSVEFVSSIKPASDVLVTMCNEAARILIV